MANMNTAAFPKVLERPRRPLRYVASLGDWKVTLAFDFVFERLGFEETWNSWLLVSKQWLNDSVMKAMTILFVVCWVLIFCV